MGVTGETIRLWLNRGIPLERAIDVERKSHGAVSADEILMEARKGVAVRPSVHVTSRETSRLVFPSWFASLTDEQRVELAERCGETIDSFVRKYLVEPERRAAPLDVERFYKLCLDFGATFTRAEFASHFPQAEPEYRSPASVVPKASRLSKRRIGWETGRRRAAPAPRGAGKR